MRLVCLDVFRGMAIAAMIVANNPGSWEYVYSPLKHAEWHGCSPIDLVFPFFLFVVGVAMAFSFAKYNLDNNSDNRATVVIYLRILRRCLILFGLGLFLAIFSMFLDWLFNDKVFDLNNLRIMGVLQRISLTYFLAGMVIFNVSRRGQWAIAIFGLLGYWLAMQFIPTPGYAPGELSPEGNLAGYIDRVILGSNHLYQTGSFDPEGLLSTIPATVTVLLGFFTGKWLEKQSINSGNSFSLVVFGLSCLVVGKLWDFIFPINKQLWTSSYVMFTAGWALIVLAGCYELIEVRGKRGWGFPLEVMGLNAIFLFVASGIVARILLKIPVVKGEKPLTIYAWIYQNFFQAWAGNWYGSLLFAVITLCIWWVVLYIMYRRGWFWKV